VSQVALADIAFEGLAHLVAFLHIQLNRESFFRNCISNICILLQNYLLKQCGTLKLVPLHFTNYLQGLYISSFSVDSIKIPIQYQHKWSSTVTRCISQAINTPFK